MEVYGGVKRTEGNTYSHCPTDIVKKKKFKRRFRVGCLDLPERRKRRIGSREKEEVNAQVCPCGKALKSRTHTVEENEINKAKQDVFEEDIREIDERDGGGVWYTINI